MAREMKSSGLPWVGKIPSDWEIKRLKHAADYFYKGNGITKEEVFEDGDISCIRYGEIYSKYNGAFVNCISKTKLMVQESPRHIKKGDILFACTGELVEEIGKNIVYMGDNPCLVGGDIIVMRHQQNPIFLNYALNSYAQVQKSEGKAKLKVVHISSKDVQNLIVLLPALPEQQVIADFLDTKCAEIDGMLADLDAEVRTLTEYKKSIIAETVTRGLNPNAPMKQSGIPWAETIPAHWAVQPVYKHFHDRVFMNLDYEYQRAFKFNYGTLKYKEEVGDLAFYKPTYIKYSKVKRGDLIINGLNLNYDFISQRVAITPEDGIITSAYIAIRPFKGVYSEYFCYLFKAMDNMKLFHGMGKGVRLTLSFDELKRVKIPIPTKDEQLAIVSFLDEKCAAIDQAITDKQTQIETLKSYKASLIYEYVTGKKQVI